jgi:hypothetical protein
MRSSRQLAFPRWATTFVRTGGSHNFVSFWSGGRYLHHSFRCSHCGGWRMSPSCEQWRQQVFAALRNGQGGQT